MKLVGGETGLIPISSGSDVAPASAEPCGPALSAINRLECSRFQNSNSALPRLVIPTKAGLQLHLDLLGPSASARVTKTRAIHMLGRGAATSSAVTRIALNSQTA